MAAESEFWSWIDSVVGWSFKWRVPGLTGVVITLGCFYLVQCSIGFRPELGELGFASPWVLGGMTGAVSNLVVLNLSVVLHYAANKDSAPRKAVIGITCTFLIAFFMIGFMVWTYDDIREIAQRFTPFDYVQIRDKAALMLHAKQDLLDVFYRIVLALSVLSALVIGLDLLMFPDAKKSERDALLFFDIMVLSAILMTIFVPYYLGGYAIWGRSWPIDVSPAVNFLIAFKAGAIAFEILLACMLFDPRHFFSK